MTVETATYINGLNASYPASGDQKSEGDNHMRLIKSTLKATFPNISGAVSPTHLELNYVEGVTSAIQDQINRTLRQSGGSAVSAIPDAATRANKVLGFDSSGNPVTTIANADLAAAVTAAGNAATSETNAAASAVAAAASAASVDAAGIAASIATKTTGPASATDNAIARFDATTGKLLQNSPVTVSDTGDVAGVVSINGGQLAGLRNKIINGNFGNNQRGYVSGAATTAGQYTFDRWKATGTGGITFSTTANKTTVTIPSGQTLQQVIEGLNIETGTYVLSWGGTAQGRINGGSYGASGAVTASLTGGNNVTIEFNTGTVERVQLEIGSVATPFEHRPFGVELMLCQRYFEKSYEIGTAPGSATSTNGHYSASTGGARTGWHIPYAVVKRVNPTVTFWDFAGNVGRTTQCDPTTGAKANNSNNIATNSGGTTAIELEIGVTANAYYAVHWTSSAEL